MTEDFPILGTGKTDYITLSELAFAAEETGSGWLSKLTQLVKKHEPLEPNQKSEKDNSEDITVRAKH